MNLLILGATGKVGRLVVAEALARGHDVTALVRNPAKVAQTHPHLTVITGNLKDPDVMRQALAGQDAVISALGHKSLAKSDIQTAATRAVLAALQPGQRFVSLTGQGVSDPRDPAPTLGARLVTAGIKLVPGGLYADGAAHARLMRESAADWTLVRSPVMTGGAATHHYRVGYLKIGLFTTARRADVARFMVAAATDPAGKWSRQAPMVASRQ
ncbi:MAG TPA: NAD(P)H-binding protein [Candidatus Saccharimonadia bacterium]|nr:NAD(P)H-binding protein [Candidatus Saccharimonadia bacterium]